MKNRICIAVFVMGFSGLLAQILLLRELLIVYSGNELCIGIILANWLILEALGCYLTGRWAGSSRYVLEIFTIITILFSAAFPAAAFLTRILKSILGISIGESIGLLPMVYSSFLILLPVCILHGALFPFSCRIYAMVSGMDASSAGRVYVYETAGAIIGGIVCTCILIPYGHTFQACLWLAVLNGVVCLVLLAPNRGPWTVQKNMLVVPGVLLSLCGYAMFTGLADKLHRYSIKAQWKNLNTVHYQNSQYGNICIIENQEQYIFFLDGVPDIITPVPDPAFIEEFVHIPLLVHPEPAALLILGKGAGGVVHEAFKHESVKNIDYAELDPLLLELLRKFSTPLTESELNDPRVAIALMDGRLFMKTTRNRYDVILIGIMEPGSLQANRFFTKEFFSLVKKRLNPGGVLVLGLPGSLMYANEGLKNLNSCIFHTLKHVFSHIRVVPGDGRNLFLSSATFSAKAEINLKNSRGYSQALQDIERIDEKEIIARLIQRNIRTDDRTFGHIEKKLHQGWAGWFSRFIEGSSQQINSDFRPIGLFYNLSHWNALYAPTLNMVFKEFERINLNVIGIALGVFLLFYLFFRSKNYGLSRAGIPLSIITTGFGGMIFDLMFIFTFQCIYGYVFSWIALLVSSFMAGAAFGAWFVDRVRVGPAHCYKLFIRIEIAIICFSFAWPFIFIGAHSGLSSPGGFFFLKMLLLMITCISGLLTGSQFPLANRIYLKNSTSVSRTAGLLYASDLLGGWLGGIIGAVVLLPVLGLTNTCITVGLVKLTSFIVLITQPGGKYGDINHE